MCGDQWNLLDRASDYEKKGVVFEQVDLRREMVKVRFLEINHYNHYNHYKNHEKVMVSNGRVMVEPKK